MSLSPNSSLVRRTIDLNYENKKRASSLKWIAVNGVLFAVFTYDLSCKNPNYTSYLHYVELVLATILAANLIQHTMQLLPKRVPSVSISPQQQKLLGLKEADLDSSFVISQTDKSHNSSGIPEDDPWPIEALSISSRLRSMRETSPVSPPSSPSSPHSPRSRSSLTSQSPHSPDQFTKDEFIADRNVLAKYLRHYEERSRGEDSSWGEVSGWGVQLAPALPTTHHYQLAPVDSEVSRGTEESGAGSGPHMLRKLHLDPQRLTKFNMNLRLWIHVTILQRLVAEMERVDLALGGAGAEWRVGAAPPDRLGPPAAALAPFLALHPDQHYLVRRIKDLCSGGCLSAYKWDGGGAGWDESHPPDAELVLRLVATYLDTQLPRAATPRPFSDVHLSAPAPASVSAPASAPATTPRAARDLVIHRVSMRPPHYVLMLGDEPVEVCRGRNNMLHTLLVLLAAAARHEPPALQRVHLGRAGLNMLWIIGR